MLDFLHQINFKDMSTIGAFTAFCVLLLKIAPSAYSNARNKDFDIYLQITDNLHKEIASWKERYFELESKYKILESKYSDIEKRLIKLEGNN